MKKLSYVCFRFIRWVVKLVYPKTAVFGAENLPAEPCVMAGNHTQMNGPIVGELYMPGDPLIWCAAEMMELKAVPAYAYQDFWSRKPGYIKWFFKLASYVIAPICVCVFNNARTIPVYRDQRVTRTFKASLAALKEGTSVVIFPEYDAPHDHILCDFQEGFVDVARSYYKQTGKALPFVPVYLAPSLGQVHIGKPVYFDPQAPIRDERRRICDRLMADITAIATSLPRHKVVPYNNLPKKDYTYNVPEVS